MSNEIMRGVGSLRDLGPAGGVYDADYIIHLYKKSTTNVGCENTQHSVFTAQIRPVGDRSLKNGQYSLEQDGKSLFTLRKTGHLWDLVENLQPIRTDNDNHK